MSCFLCHSHVSMAALCLGSLLRCHEGSITVNFHDDGSLTSSDVDELRSGVPSCCIIRRKDADERMSYELRRFPAQRRFRTETCMGLKLCDTVYHNPSEVYVYSDADVLYLRPFAKLFDLPDSSTNALFMYDSVDNTYSFRSWQLMLARGVLLPQRVNAGLACMRKSSYDPEFIEWFLSVPARGGKRHNGVPEQTAWAALGMRVGCRLWSPESVAVGRKGLTISPKLIAAHFVGMFRSSMKDYVKPGLQANSARIIPATMSARRCSSAHLAIGEFKRIASRGAKRLLARFNHYRP